MSDLVGQHAIQAGLVPQQRFQRHLLHDDIPLVREIEVLSIDGNRTGSIRDPASTGNALRHLSIGVAKQNRVRPVSGQSSIGRIVHPCVRVVDGAEGSVPGAERDAHRRPAVAGTVMSREIRGLERCGRNLPSIADTAVLQEIGIPREVGCDLPLSSDLIFVRPGDDIAVRVSKPPCHHVADELQKEVGIASQLRVDVHVPGVEAVDRGANGQRAAVMLDEMELAEAHAPGRRLEVAIGGRKDEIAYPRHILRRAGNHAGLPSEDSAQLGQDKRRADRARTLEHVLDP